MQKYICKKKVHRSSKLKENDRNKMQLKFNEQLLIEICIKALVNIKQYLTVDYSQNIEIYTKCM